MRIGFNAQIISDSGAGVVNVAKNIIHNLVILSSDHEYFIFGNPKYLSKIKSNNSHIIPTCSLVEGSSKRILWEQCVLPFKMSRYKLNVMVYPDHTAAIIKKSCPSIITVHDIAFISVPETFKSTTRFYKTQMVKRSVTQAIKIIVISEFTKHEVMKYLDVPESKLKVVYLGIDECYKNIVDKALLSTVVSKYHLKEKFILFVGTLEPRKNIQRLIQGYAILKKRKKIIHDLVIVGSKGWLFTNIFEAISKLGIQEEVKFLGYIPDSDLPILYSLADVFVYPSLYEGFGLPPLEAMACGCPVVTSNQTSLPEVVGDAAELVNPYESEAIANGIFRVIDDNKYRQLLCERGLQRTTQFTWQQTALKFMNIFNEVQCELS